jgi:hypothetical protein
MPFALSNPKDYTLYLVYGTSNKVGVERMKDAMWKIDPVDGTAFKDPLDPNQLTLEFNQPDLTALKAGVVEALQARAPQAVEELRMQRREMRQLAAAPEYVVGSVHAVTDGGSLLIASATGSQLGPLV